MDYSWHLLRHPPGGEGLHVVVLLNPPSDWVTVKQFTQRFAAAMTGAHPMDFVATSTKAKRNMKIYVDYLRNKRGATAVASYFLRGRSAPPRHARPLGSAD